ncbi:non-ribosomal peptide synthetase [Micromonospora sp. RTGN7]|uniref:non-ribosomal peptide synthetase n=1 Tax=Micromonospora sp. RTGN7 TaxID=3016526 RepID=UPI0029FF05D0|nr:non-ribosomal peptide synthetase [Micromonospora sp. RTGN7]
MTRALQAYAAEAGVADFVPLSICAAVLARRLSRPGSPCRAWVVRGAREAVTPGPGAPMDPTESFRTALRRAADLRVLSAPDSVAGQPVDVTIVVSQDGTHLYAESMTSSADAPTADCWARSFLRLLTGLAGEPDAPMSRHPLVDDADRQQILHRLNPYRSPQVRHRSMTEPFEEQARRTPDDVALLDENGTTVTYRDLDERANRLANYLAGRGAGPGTRVGICLERGIPQIVAIYAAVKAGAIYVPLDAELPDARLAYILSDAGPQVVLADPACRQRIPSGAWEVVDVADDAPWRDGPATLPAPANNPGGLLHILYTSGTTGRPKGVAYPTAGALAHLDWMQSRYPFGPGDAALFKTSPGFDVSTWELFWPLYHGARLVICRPGGHRDPKHLAGLIERYRVTTVFLPPTVMAPFLETVSPQRARALRWALCGGEPVTPRIRDTFYATLDATLVNCYGPTEAGNVTDMALPPEPGAPVVPLGRPAANFRILLLDENLDLVPVGTPGEAYIGGETGVAQSYWQAPRRTAERFVADPYGAPGSRLYRTGDLCRYRDDGVLEHLGRIDRQIKIRGQRVEPGEIESVLGSHPAVENCAVVAHGDPTRLLAFVVPAGRVAVNDLDVVAVGEYAARSLPDHMRPERIMPVLRIPATVNGKIDKDALVALWRATVETGREIVPPADELEAALVDIYRDVLDVEEVSVLDTFGQLGGHSMLAFTLLGECQEKMHAQPDVAELLGGTVRDVAASIRARRAGS